MGQIPNAMMINLVEVRPGKPVYRPDLGGQYLPGPDERISFRGAVLPMSEQDLRYAAQGTYTEDSRKIYTNEYIIKIGSKVIDEAENVTYTVQSELAYGKIHSMKRYIAVRKGTS